MADASGHGADQHFMGAGLVDLDILDHEGFAHFAQNGSFHPDFLLFAPASWVSGTGWAESSPFE